MPSSTSSASERKPVHIELEFVRAKEADDAFAFRFSRQTYLIRGRQGAYQTAELPWSRDLLADLDEVRRPDRDPATVAQVGDMLREFLEPAGWSSHEATIVQARADRRPVHLTVRSAAAELYALPWELLTLRADGQHLGALDHVLLRYAWPGTTTTSEDEQTPHSGRLLMAWSAAGGGVPAAEQTKAIHEAAEGTEAEVEILENATYGKLADALEAAAAEGKPFRALHLLCHGAEAGSTFGLSFDAEDGGRPTVVDAGRLQQLLAPHAEATRLVVVSACDGGNMGEPGNRIGSVAQRLHRAGIQYVVASRFPLSARGSTRMTGALYQSLWQGDPVERAFVRARTATSREVTQLDWASLQLYARPEDGDRGCVLAIDPWPAPTAAAPAVVATGPGDGSKPSHVSTLVADAIPPRPASGSGARTGLMAAALLLAGGLAAFFMFGRDPEPTAAPAQPVAQAKNPAPANDTPTPTPSPVAATDTGAQDESSSGDPEPDLPPDLGTAATPTPTPRKNPAVSRPPKPKPAPKEVTRCSRTMAKALNGEMNSPNEGIYKVQVRVGEDGSVKLLSCKDCGAQKDAASQGLAKIKPAKVLSKWKDELPCKASFNWQ